MSNRSHNFQPTNARVYAYRGTLPHVRAIPACSLIVHKGLYYQSQCSCMPVASVMTGHCQQFLYVQLAVDDNGKLMDCAGDAGFKLKVYIGSANFARAFKEIDPNDTVTSCTQNKPETLSSTLQKCTNVFSIEYISNKLTVHATMSVHTTVINHCVAGFEHRPVQPLRRHWHPAVPRILQDARRPRQHARDERHLHRAAVHRHRGARPAQEVGQVGLGTAEAKWRRCSPRAHGNHQILLLNTTNSLLLHRCSINLICHNSYSCLASPQQQNKHLLSLMLPTTILLPPSSLQYIATNLFDLTCSKDEQRAASEVSGLGHAAKQRRAAVHEALLAKKLAGEAAFTRTMKRRLLRRGTFAVFVQNKHHKSDPRSVQRRVARHLSRTLRTHQVLRQPNLIVMLLPMLLLQLLPVLPLQKRTRRLPQSSNGKLNIFTAAENVVKTSLGVQNNVSMHAGLHCDLHHQEHQELPRAVMTHFNPIINFCLLMSPSALRKMANPTTKWDSLQLPVKESGTLQMHQAMRYCRADAVPPCLATLPL